MSDQTMWDKLAAGLEQAAEAARDCAKEENSEDYDESKETPVEKQPKDLKAAGKEAYSRLRGQDKK